MAAESQAGHGHGSQMAQAADTQGPGSQAEPWGHETLRDGGGSPPAGQLGRKWVLLVLIFVSENTDGIPSGDIGFGLRAQEWAARLAGGHLTDLREGARARAERGRVLEALRSGVGLVNHSLLKEGGVWAMRGASHMDRLLFIYSLGVMIMGDSQSLP